MIMLFGLSHLQWTSWHHNCVHWDLTWVRQSEGLWVCNQSREPCMQPSKEPTVHILIDHLVWAYAYIYKKSRRCAKQRCSITQREKGATSLKARTAQTEPGSTLSCEAHYYIMAQKPQHSFPQNVSLTCFSCILLYKPQRRDSTSLFCTLDEIMCKWCVRLDGLQAQSSKYHRTDLYWFSDLCSETVRGCCFH